ncbi:hypothetical protein [Bdellovibrio sp. HCB274]|uniref:hypothetical protein n=1 Tax=Bdellovibrio sp. HCB274 TaxID=3394361 RepID=UPI0039B3A995
MKKLTLLSIFLVFGMVASPAMAECDLDAYLNAGHLTDQQVADFEQEISKCRSEEAGKLNELAKFEAMLAKMKPLDEMLVDHNAALDKAISIRRKLSFKISQLLDISPSNSLEQNLAVLREAVLDRAYFNTEVGRLKFEWKRLLSANEEVVGKEAYAYLSGKISVDPSIQESILSIRQQFPVYFWNSSKVPTQSVNLAVKSNDLFGKAISMAEEKIAAQFTDRWNKNAYGDMLGQVQIYKADLYWNTVSKRMAFDEALQRSRKEKYFGVIEINLKELEFLKLQLSKVGEKVPGEIKKPLSEKIAKKLSELETVAADLQKQDTQRARKALSLSIGAKETKLKSLGCSNLIGEFDKTKLSNKALELYYSQLEVSASTCRGAK